MRYHYLDSVRALLMSLGFLFHASLIFSLNKWHINVQAPQSIFSFSAMILHSFRMQGFYLIAGFFAMMLLKNYSIKEFLKKRIIRLGIPVIFIGFIFNTVMVIVLSSNKHTNSFPDIFSIKYFMGGYFLDHLWFLPNLIFYCCILALIYKYFPAIIAKCTEYRFGFLHIYFLIIFLALVFAAFLKYFPKSPYDNWFIFNKHNFGYYLPFFILGAIFFLNKNVFENFINLPIGNLCILVSAIVLSISAEALPLTKYVRYLLQFLIALSSNGILFKLINKFFDYNDKRIRSISDASYTMYLLHQPVLVISACYLIKTNLNNWCLFFILVLSTWSITYLFHLHVVRKFPIISFLFNGQYLKK